VARHHPGGHSERQCHRHRWRQQLVRALAEPLLDAMLEPPEIEALTAEMLTAKALG
jgi:hypothetical protein